MRPLRSSDCGQTKVPWSRRVVNRHNPLPCQKRILIRFALRGSLVANASCPSRPADSLVQAISEGDPLSRCRTCRRGYAEAAWHRAVICSRAPARRPRAPIGAPVHGGETAGKYHHEPPGSREREERSLRLAPKRRRPVSNLDFDFRPPSGVRQVDRIEVLREVGVRGAATSQGSSSRFRSRIS